MARVPKKGNTFLIIVTAVSIMILLFSCYKLINRNKDKGLTEDSVQNSEIVDLSIAESIVSEESVNESYLEVKLPDVIAHRGYCSIAPENTIEAFRRAVDVGADMIELDVQLTKDGYIVVFHDLDLSRIVGSKKTISDYTYSELLALDFGSYKSSYFTGMSSSMMKDNFAGTKISTLDEVLEYASSQNITVNLELKDLTSAKGISSAQKDTFAAMVVSRVYAYDMEDQVIFASFNHNYLAEIERLNSDNKTLYVTHEGGAASLINNYPADAYSIDLAAITSDDVEFFHNAGYPVYVWTANSSEMMLYALSLGSDGIITNYPGIASVLIHDEYSYLRDHYVGTMTAPTLYDYANISSFSGYVLSDMTAIIPHKEEEDEDSKETKKVSDESFLALSAYDIDNKTNSIIYIMNMNGELVKMLDTGITSDIKGIAYDNSNDLLWLITGDEYIYALNYSELSNGKHNLSYPIDKDNGDEPENMEEQPTLSDYSFLYGAYKLSDINGVNGSRASFIYYDDSKLYVCYDDTKLGVLEITLEEDREDAEADNKSDDEEYKLILTQKKTLIIPENISGISMRYVYPEIPDDDKKKDNKNKDKDEEEVKPTIYIVMTSAVNGTDSGLIITEYKDEVTDYSQVINGGNENIIPSMALSPCVIDDRIFLGFASSSRPYFNDASIPNDQIWILDFE